MSGISTTPGGINPNPRNTQDHVLNWQRLAQWLSSGALAIDPATGGLSINVTAPLSNSGGSISLSIDEVSGLVVLNSKLAANTHYYTAGEVLSGDRIVYVGTDEKVYTADSATTVAGTVIGITRAAALLGAQVPVLTSGRVITLAGLSPGGLYFLGTAGAITAAPPTSGILQTVGVALNSTTLVMDLGPPIMLA